MALTTKFDPIFRRYQGTMPVAFLRALAQRESGLNPSAANSSSPNAARGLMQIVGVARDGYNQAHGTLYTSADLLDPDISVRIGSDLLNRIIGYYKKYSAPNMKEDWTNPEFVKLLVAGWNAGYSKGGGVQKVVDYLQAHNTPVTHDNVVKYAGAAGAVSQLQNPERQSWHRSVADLYYQQPDWRTGAGSIMPLLLVALTTWGAYQLLR